MLALDDGKWRIEVASRDRPGLLATVSGVIADAGLDILDAAVATWGDGGALDSFVVQRAVLALTSRSRGARAAPRSRSDRARGSDRRRVRPRARVACEPGSRAALRRPRVAVVHDVRGAQPRPARPAAQPHRGDGERGANVHSARLVTIDGTAVDRFELTDRNGRKLDTQAKAGVGAAVRNGVTPEAAQARPPPLTRGPSPLHVDEWDESP